MNEFFACLNVNFFGLRSAMGDDFVILEAFNIFPLLGGHCWRHFYLPDGQSCS